ncbi:anti-sigma factor family protein [Lysinibacillus sp. NPDC097195]|uniref:anti-sigma factor family protein n=1 Tax=Lysinibacillus sp. NPDC097195 TaxID=3364141 RepID=UPI00380C2AE8
MNCLSTDEMHDFIDGRIVDDKMMQMDKHIQSCASCFALLDEQLKTEQLISSPFSKVYVDDSFTNQVMEQLPKKKTLHTKKRNWRATFVAAVFVTAALLFLVFSTVQQEPVTSSKPITIKVKDVKLTDAFVTVTLVASGYNSDELFFRESVERGVELELPNGKREDASYFAEYSTNEITYEFALFDITHDEFTLLFNFQNINDLDRQLTLEVPIDRRELLAQTETVTLRSTFEKDGVNVNFIRAQHGPQNSLFKFETKFTEEMATFVEQQVDKFTAGLPLKEKEAYAGYNAQILYDVIDADGQKLPRSVPEDNINIQNDRYAHTDTISAYPSVQEGGYIAVTGAKFELPTNVRHPLTLDQLPYTFTYKDTLYEIKLLSDQRLEISSDAETTTIKNWHITVDNKTAWDTSRFREDKEKQYITFTFDEGINLNSFILYGQTELKYIYFDEPIRVDIR